LGLTAQAPISIRVLINKKRADIFAN